MTNPYWDTVGPLIGGGTDEPWDDHLTVPRFRTDDPQVEWKRRDAFTNVCSWAIPSPEALAAVAAHSPLVEVGAGTGYWARQLTDLGADVVAYDQHPPRKAARVNYWHRNTETWFPVKIGDVDSVKGHADRTLFLCWPPYGSPMAAMTLDLYDGDTVLYIGEGQGGCTGGDDFHHALDEHWTEVDRLVIAHWEGLQDDLTVWRR